MTRDEVLSLIKQRSAIAKVDPRIIAGVIGVETGGKYNSDAKNPSSSASGLGQFMGFNFKSGRYAHDPFDPVQSIDATIKMAKDNSRTSGIPLTVENVGAIYGMHQQGAGAFKKAMQNPNASAESIFGKEAARLNGMAGMNAGQGLNMFGKKASLYAGLSQSGGGQVQNQTYGDMVQPDNQANEIQQFDNGPTDDGLIQQQDQQKQILAQQREQELIAARAQKSANDARQLEIQNMQQQENLNIDKSPDYSAQLAKAFGVMPTTDQIPDDLSAMIRDLYDNA